jgi:hypothetical protein
VTLRAKRKHRRVPHRVLVVVTEAEETNHSLKANPDQRRTEEEAEMVIGAAVEAGRPRTEVGQRRTEEEAGMVIGAVVAKAAPHQRDPGIETIIQENHQAEVNLTVVSSFLAFPSTYLHTSFAA